LIKKVIFLFILFLRVIFTRSYRYGISRISTETQSYFDIKLIQTKLDRVKENVAKTKTPI